MWYRVEKFNSYSFLKRFLSHTPHLSSRIIVFPNPDSISQHFRVQKYFQYCSRLSQTNEPFLKQNQNNKQLLPDFPLSSQSETSSQHSSFSSGNTDKIRVSLWPIHAVITNRGHCVRLIMRQQYSFPSVNLSPARQFKQLDNNYTHINKSLAQSNHFFPAQKTLLNTNSLTPSNYSTTNDELSSENRQPEIFETFSCKALSCYHSTHRQMSLYRTNSRNNDIPSPKRIFQ